METKNNNFVCTNSSSNGAWSTVFFSLEEWLISTGEIETKGFKFQNCRCWVNLKISLAVFDNRDCAIRQEIFSVGNHGSERRMLTILARCLSKSSPYFVGPFLTLIFAWAVAFLDNNQPLLKVINVSHGAEEDKDDSMIAFVKSNLNSWKSAWRLFRTTMFRWRTPAAQFVETHWTNLVLSVKPFH